MLKIMDFYFKVGRIRAKNCVKGDFLGKIPKKFRACGAILLPWYILGGSCPTQAKSEMACLGGELQLSMQISIFDRNFIARRVRNLPPLAFSEGGQIIADTLVLKRGQTAGQPGNLCPSVTRGGANSGQTVFRH